MRVCGQTYGMHGMLRYGKAHKLINKEKSSITRRSDGTAFNVTVRNIAYATARNIAWLRRQAFKPFTPPRRRAASFPARKQTVDELTRKPRGTVSAFKRKALGEQIELILGHINALLCRKTVNDMQICLLIGL